MNLLPLHTLEWPRSGEITAELCQELAAMLNKNPFTEEDEEEFRKLCI
jgi:hypothetical protein